MDSEQQSFQRIAEQKSSDVQLWADPLPGSPSLSMSGLGFRRFRDFDPPDAPGQDFAALRATRGHVVGLVVDGVSQSFFGDLAAREVGGELLSFLWENRTEPPAQEILADCLESLRSRVNERVRTYPISAPEGSILRVALEETREDGTEAVFAAFILDLRTRNLVLYHLGDVHAWVLDAAGQWGEQPLNARGRWSSAKRKHQSLTRTEMSDIAGALLHSDGIPRSWVLELGGPLVSKIAFEAEADVWAARDDVSFVSVALLPQVLASKPSPAQPVEANSGTDPVPSNTIVFSAFLEDPESGILVRGIKMLRNRISLSVLTLILLFGGILLAGLLSCIVFCRRQ